MKHSISFSSLVFTRFAGCCISEVRKRVTEGACASPRNWSWSLHHDMPLSWHLSASAASAVLSGWGSSSFSLQGLANEYTPSQPRLGLSRPQDSAVNGVMFRAVKPTQRRGHIQKCTATWSQRRVCPGWSAPTSGLVPRVVTPLAAPTIRSWDCGYLQRQASSLMQHPKGPFVFKNMYAWEPLL